MKMKNILILIVAVWLTQVASGQNAVEESDKPVTITGKVLNLEKKPVEGAIFFIDNIRTNFKSKSNGSYKIKVSPSSGSLKVFSPEYGFVETLIEGRTTIDFTLTGPASPQNGKQDKPEAKESVDIGYGSEDPKNLTSPVNSIDGKGDKYSSYTDIYQMLTGTVPGIQVVGRNITIRGQASFTLSSEPLYVVDGIIVNSIDGISPREVRSIEVLKGASASIYGTQGGNGVILIHLKGNPEKK